MKFGLTLVACFAVMFAVATPSTSEAANYRAICKTTKLKASERRECRARMKAAESEGERAQIFKEFDLRSIGLGLDGKPLKK